MNGVRVPDFVRQFCTTKTDLEPVVQYYERLDNLLTLFRNVFISIYVWPLRQIKYFRSVYMQLWTKLLLKLRWDFGTEITLYADSWNVFHLPLILVWTVSEFRLVLQLQCYAEKKHVFTADGFIIIQKQYCILYGRETVFYKQKYSRYKTGIILTSSVENSEFKFHTTTEELFFIFHNWLYMSINLKLYFYVCNTCSRSGSISYSTGRKILDVFCLRYYGCILCYD